MGRSWPIQMSRRGFRPAFLQNDTTRAENPEEDMGGDEFNALAWCATGTAATADKAWAILSATGTLVAHAEVWNPDGDPAVNDPPEPARVSEGVYTLTYAKEYFDEDRWYELYSKAGGLTQAAVKRSVALYGAKGFPQGSTPNVVAVGDVALVGSVWVVTMRVTLANTGALVDSKLLIEVR